MATQILTVTKGHDKITITCSSDVHKERLISRYKSKGYKQVIETRQSNSKPNTI